MRRWTRERKRQAWIKTGYSIYYAIFLVFIYGPMIAMFVLSFQGQRGGTSFPMRGVSFYWWGKLIEPSTVGDLQGAMGRSLILALIVMVIIALFSTMLAMAFRKRFWGSGLLFYTVMSGLMVPGILLSLGLGNAVETGGHPARVVVVGAGRSCRVDAALRILGDDGGLQPIRQQSGRSRPGHGRGRMDRVQGSDVSAHPAWNRSGRPVRFYTFLR